MRSKQAIEDVIRRRLRPSDGARHVSPIQRDTLLADGETAVQAAIVGPRRVTVIVTLPQADAGTRRGLLRSFAAIGTSKPKPVEWVRNSRSQDVPIAFEVTGNRGPLLELVRSASLAGTISGWEYPLDAPTFVRGAGKLKEDNCSASSRRAMRTKFMRKDARQAVYDRMSPEAKSAIRQDEKRSAEAIAELRESVFGAIWDAQEQAAELLRLAALPEFTAWKAQLSDAALIEVNRRIQAAVDCLAE